MRTFRLSLLAVAAAALLAVPAIATAAPAKGHYHTNVHAGVIYLKHLLQQTGGDENTAIAGYYQGLGAVRSRGLFDDTQQYVANVQALRSRFGG